MKFREDKAVYGALFLLGIVLLIESAATMFVLMEVPQVASGTAGVAWLYVVIKSLVGLYALLIGSRALKK